MSVQIINPETPIKLSDAAKAHFRQRIESAGEQGIRLRIKPSGCTGYMYDLELVADQPADDLIIALDDEMNLYIERASIPLLQGTDVDYVREGLNQVLKFSNPRAEDYCGCGESFSLVGGEQD